MKLRPSRWFKWQSGQAMAEYWVTIPGSIIIMLSAAALVQFITGGLLRTYEGLHHTGGLDCQVQPEEPQEGPTTTQLGCYQVELVARSYDAKTDRTTVGYKVTDTCGGTIQDSCTPYTGGKTLLCHKAGKANEPSNSIVLELSASGVASHLDEHGTPLAGHEQDFLIKTPEDFEACFADRKGGGGGGVGGNKSTLSRWTLALSKGIANEILSSSDNYSYGRGPSTGVTGLNFNVNGGCGVEKPAGLSICHISGLASDPSNYHLMENMPMSAYLGHMRENGTTQAGHEQDFIVTTEEDRQRCLAGPRGDGSKGKGGKAMGGGIVLASFDRGFASTLLSPVSLDSRTVLLTLSGYYEWGLTEIALDTGTEVYHGVITAPISAATPPDQQDQCQQ